jgi:hypothetical protein
MTILAEQMGSSTSPRVIPRLSGFPMHNAHDAHNATPFVRNYYDVYTHA